MGDWMDLNEFTYPVDHETFLMRSLECFSSLPKSFSLEISCEIDEKGNNKLKKEEQEFLRKSINLIAEWIEQ